MSLFNELLFLNWTHPLLFPYRLNILVLGGDTGFVDLYAYGMYKIASLGGVRLFCKFTRVTFFIF